jgi:hypothetical protein
MGNDQFDIPTCCSQQAYLFRRMSSYVSTVVQGHGGLMVSKVVANVYMENCRIFYHHVLIQRLVAA